MQGPASAERVEEAKTAAAVICLMEGSNAPVQRLLDGLASPEQLEQIARQLQGGDRPRRARVLASFLSRLALQLDTWSLR